jgi:parallel beta-helix repeat protein
MVMICVIGSLLFLGAAWAGDGQIDIATLPYNISGSGSYIVVKDLATTATDIDGITISADDVTLDLNGHTLKGPGKSAGTTGSGIVNSGTRTNITICNGTVRDWRAYGVDVTNTDNSQFEALRCYSNGGVGIGAGYGCTLTNNTCAYNDGGGISTGASTVSGNSCRLNAGNGIQIIASGTVIGNTCVANSGHGISGSFGSTITGNTCDNSGNHGISASASTISGNTCRNNTGDGINAESNSTVSGNTCEGNSNDGIEVYYASRVFDSNCTSNGPGGSDGAGIHAAFTDNQIMNNHCIANDRGLDLDAANNIVSGNTLRGNTIPVDAVANNQLDILISDLPYIISQPGTYRLSGDLYLAAQNSDGITINTDDVTLDLNGHALIGPGKAAGSIGSGIRVGGAGYINIIIRNGTVRDWREHGVYAASATNGRFEDLVCYNNGTNGLYTGYSCLAQRIVSFANGGAGILTRQHSTLNDNICTGNSGNGITTEGFNNVTGNICNYNAADGINADMDCIVSESNCNGNTGDGIEVRLRCRVVNNRCNNNGYLGDGAGINATNSGSTIEHNMVTDNDRGIDCNPATGNYIASNRATGNTTNYDIVGGNTQGAGDLANVSF